MTPPSLPTSALPACLRAVEAYDDIRGSLACALASQTMTAASIACRTPAAAVDWMYAAVILSGVKA